MAQEPHQEVPGVAAVVAAVQALQLEFGEGTGQGRGGNRGQAEDTTLEVHHRAYLGNQVPEGKEEAQSVVHMAGSTLGIEAVGGIPMVAGGGPGLVVRETGNEEDLERQVPLQALVQDRVATCSVRIRSAKIP